MAKKPKRARAVSKRAAKDDLQKSTVMEAVSGKPGHRSGAALTYSISREEMCLGKMARWMTYTPSKISQSELNSKYLRDVLQQYWVSNFNPPAKCPFLSIYLYKLYLAEEFATMIRFIKFLIGAAADVYQDRPFAQCVHDGDETVGLQFIGARCDRNFVVVIGFEVLESGKACDVADLIEAAAQFTLGRSIDSVTNVVTSDGAALAVAEQDEIFPGGPTSEL